jgi:hypothetical protein
VSKNQAGIAMARRNLVLYNLLPQLLPIRSSSLAAGNGTFAAHLYQSNLVHSYDIHLLRLCWHPSRMTVCLNYVVSLESSFECSLRCSPRIIPHIFMCITRNMWRYMELNR